MELRKDQRQTTGALQAPSLDLSGTQAAAQTVRQVSRMALPLQERLNQFSGKTLALGTKKMIQNAKEQAVVDVESGNFQEFGLKDGASIYNMAYDDAAKTSYISQTTADIQADAKLVAAQNKYSPEGFKTAWAARVSEINRQSKKISPFVEAVINDTATQYGDAAYAQLAGNLATIQYNTMVKNNNEALSMYEQEFISAKTSGNENAAQTALINRNQVLKSMQETYQITDVGIETANKIFEKNVIKGQVTSNFGEAVKIGEGSGFILEFKAMAEDNSEFDRFTPDELDGMVSEMYKSLGEKMTHEGKVLSAEKNRREQISMMVIDTFNEAWIAGTLTQPDVDAALDADTISDAQHKAYSLKVHDTGAPFTDTSVELKVVRNIASLSDTDIMNIGLMTNEDKMKYIKQLRTYQASDEGKWTSTVQGRASLEMLKNRFNIVGAGMLSALTKPEDIAEYGQLYQNFIFEMEKLAPAQRESRAMHYAQAAIDTQDAAKIQAEGNVSDVLGKKDIADLEQRVKSYQRRIGQRKSEMYVQGLSEFQDNFGKTGNVDFRIRKEWR